MSPRRVCNFQPQAIILPQPPKRGLPPKCWNYSVSHSAQPLQSSRLSLLSSSAHRHGPPHLDNFISYFVKIGPCYVAHAGVKLLGSNDPTTLASQSVGITARKWIARIRAVKPLFFGFTVLLRAKKEMKKKESTSHLC
ncbi:UPF0764 protein C16orf89 [Plecturocebus cupreus]